MGSGEHPNRKPEIESEDQKWMEMALKWAERGKNKTRPNPAVGAIIVREGELLSAGYHRKAGEDHAEIDALKKLNWRAEGATLYVNLEPCCHYGRTGPCTDAIIAAGIKRVVAAIPDPNPKVNGLGFEKLREAGIEVKVGVLAEKAKELNRPYLTYTEKKRPFVTIKLALSLDGKIAASSGNSKWLSGPKAREWVHHLRSQSDAILIGKNTARQDNPQLTVRLVEGKNPLRLVLDRDLSLPEELKLLNPPLASGTAIFCAENAPQKKIELLTERGVEVVPLPLDQRGELSLQALMQWLYRREIQSLLVEGGGKLTASLLRERLADQLFLIYTPIIIGKSGIDAFPLELPEDLEKAIRFDKLTAEQLDRDVLIKVSITKE